MCNTSIAVAARNEISAITKSRARELRRRQTPAETRLWAALRAHRFQELHVRRQHTIGHYIADFYVSTAKLVIEVDGHLHSEPKQIEHDQHRTAFFEANGLRVIRFSNDDVIQRLEGVLLEIERACGATPS